MGLTTRKTEKGDPMKSRSKSAIDVKTVVRLFEQAGIHGVKDIAPLGAGEFNAIYAASAGGREYVIKIAPTDAARTLTYETGMMRAEVEFYRLMREVAHLRVPDVYLTDFSHAIIPADYFIMERLKGDTLDQAPLSDEERASTGRMMTEMLAQLHAVLGEGFGYPQNGLYPDWFTALSAMVGNLIQDARRRGLGSRNGKRLLSYIRQHRETLKNVESRLVNFDLWAPNIVVLREDGAVKLAWIDPERCFWGDRIADFVCLDFMKLRLEEKKSTIADYNRATDAPIAVSEAERIRFAIMLGYLGLIMEVEKYARYTVFHFGWWRNVAASRLLFSHCFHTLKECAAKAATER
jgi:fructosamine-3-kinase